MSKDDEKDIEPINTKHSKEREQSGTKNAFKNLQRDLSQDDLNSSGTQKMLLAELERLERINGELEEFKNDYYQADKEREVLKEKLKRDTATDILYSASLTMSSAVFSISFCVTESTQYILAIMSGVLFIGSIISVSYTHLTLPTT